MIFREDGYVFRLKMQIAFERSRQREVEITAGGADAQLLPV